MLSPSVSSDEFRIPLDDADGPTIGWLAGLLEGEAYFQGGAVGNGCSVRLTMSDLDVVTRVADLMAGKVVAAKVYANVNGIEMKQLFRVHVSGERARRVMETVLPFMGERRARRIQELLSFSNWGFPDSRRQPLGDENGCPRHAEAA